METVWKEKENSGYWVQWWRQGEGEEVLVDVLGVSSWTWSEAHTHTRFDNRVEKNKATDQPVVEGVAISDRGIPHSKFAELVGEGRRRLTRRMLRLGGRLGVRMGLWLSQSDLLMDRGQALCLDPQGGLTSLVLQAQGSRQGTQRAVKSVTGCRDAKIKLTKY